MAEDEKHQDQRTAEPQYTVTIEGPGVRVEQNVSKSLLPRLMGLLMNLDVTSITPPSTPRVSAPVSGTGTSPGSEPPISLIEYLEEIKARRIPERILGMANYLTEVTGQSIDGAFTKADIRPCFKAAGDPMPANFARDWQLVVQAGWVAQEAGSQDRYFVTRRGKAAIAEKFSGQAERITRIRRRWRTAGGGIASEAAPGDDNGEESAS